MTHKPAVSVVIPAHNAAGTIGATLDSAALQGEAIEILVVDDGSTDATATLVAARASADPRIRLIRQANAGVAAARNCGVEAARARLIAVIDADDLWCPGAVAALRRALEEGGDRCGLAYGSYHVIDVGNRILRTVAAGPSGDVRRAIIERNFVGSGSGVLFRRAAWADAGGYDPSLRQADAQGCEDHLFYFRLAIGWRFAAVAMPVIGYRLAPGAMSGNADRMRRSHELCLAQFAQALPEHADLIPPARARYRRWLMARAIEQGAWQRVPALFRDAARHEPGAALVELAAATLRRRRLPRSSLEAGGAHP